MIIYDLLNKKECETMISQNHQKYFITLTPKELKKLDKMYPIHSKSLLKCLENKNTISLDSFENYDFLSLVYFNLDKLAINFFNINIYLSKNLIILILSESIYDKFSSYYNSILEELDNENIINKLYYSIIDKILSETIISLELVEEIINKLENKIIKDVKNKFHIDIILLRQDTGKLKRKLRPLLYIGDHILVDENNLIDENSKKYFKNIDLRMDKIYDYTVDLDEQSIQVLNLYDSKISSKTSDVVNRLTLLTIILLPFNLISAIYGMNFKNMFFTEHDYAFLISIGIMALISLIFFVLLKIKKWY